MPKQLESKTINTDQDGSLFEGVQVAQIPSNNYQKILINMIDQDRYLIAELPNVFIELEDKAKRAVLNASVKSIDTFVCSVLEEGGSTLGVANIYQKSNKRMGI